MKLIFCLALLGFSCLSFNNKKPIPAVVTKEEKQLKQDTLIVLMGQAKEIIESKCMPCHSNHTMMPEARKRLNIDSINFLPVRKKVARLDDMIYILEKGAMPHQKFMEMRPDGTLSYSERKAIEAWADKTAVRLTRSRGSDK